MKVLQKTAAILKNACVIFAVVTFLICALGALLSDGKLATTFPALLGFFAFSLILSCLNEILKIKTIPLPFRMAIHFIGTMACFYGVFIRVGAFSDKVSGTLIIMALSAVLYAVAAALILIVAHVRKSKKRDSEKYETQFKFDK